MKLETKKTDMKKIMFIEKFGLTTAVLEGKKTMTRRIVPKKLLDVITPNGISEYETTFSNATQMFSVWEHLPYFDGAKRVIRNVNPFKYAQYQLGETVAIAQSYNDILDEYKGREGLAVWTNVVANKCDGCAGDTNKMFVRADLMPHRIKITEIKVERLQDISDEDCMSEGIYRHNAAPDALGEDRYKFISYSYDATPGKNHKRWWFHTPKEAFAALIDKVSGKGTWEKNPLVFAYGFVRV